MHFPSSHDSRPLAGIPLSGVRTFLPARTHGDCLASFPILITFREPRTKSLSVHNSWVRRGAWPASQGTRSAVWSVIDPRPGRCRGRRKYAPSSRSAIQKRRRAGKKPWYRPFRSIFVIINVPRAAPGLARGDACLKRRAGTGWPLAIGSGSRPVASLGLPCPGYPGDFAAYSNRLLNDA